TPGEGEHKIFEFVRFIKSQSDYDPSSVHVLMTPDADVMNLGMLAEYLIENLTETYNKLHIDPVPCSLEHQLLAILPEKSMKLMHPPLKTVFENKDLKLSKYLNKEIEFDSNGKLALWEAVSNVDFLDWNDVEEAIKYLESFDLKSVEIPFSCKCLPNSQILVSYTFLNFLMKWVATNTQTLNNIQDIISGKKKFNLEILTSFQNIINKSLNIFKKTSKSSYIAKKLESQYNLSFCKEILTHNQHFNEFDVVVILSDGYGLQFGSFAIVIRAHLIDIPLMENKSRMSNLKVLQHSLDLYSIDNREVVKNYPSKAALICKKYIKPRISVDDLVSQLSNSKQSQSVLFKKKESHNASQNKSQIQSNRNSTKNQHNQKNKKSIEIKPEANNQTILAQSKSSVDMQKQSVKTKKAINLDTNTVKYKQIHIKDLFSNINVSDKPKTPQRSKSYIKLSDK
ncbi:MAG: exonuclease II Exo2, partial [Paramarteilia canceri]